MRWCSYSFVFPLSADRPLAGTASHPGYRRRLCAQLSIICFAFFAGLAGAVGSCSHSFLGSFNSSLTTGSRSSGTALWCHVLTAGQSVTSYGRPRSRVCRIHLVAYACLRSSGQFPALGWRARSIGTIPRLSNSDLSLAFQVQVSGIKYLRRGCSQICCGPNLTTCGSSGRHLRIRLDRIWSPSWIAGRCSRKVRIRRGRFP